VVYKKEVEVAEVKRLPLRPQKVAADLVWIKCMCNHCNVSYSRLYFMKFLTRVLIRVNYLLSAFCCVYYNGWSGLQDVRDGYE